MNRVPLTLALAATLLATAVAGCLEDDAHGANGASGSEAGFKLHGTFTKNATQADFEDFFARTSAHGGNAAILESYPPQFIVDGFNKTACESLRTELAGVAYVQQVGACTPVTDAGPGADDSVSHEPSSTDAAADADWRVSGWFTKNATQDNISKLRTEVEALGGELAVMESYPMQYAVTILDERRCEDVRELLGTKPFVDTIRDCHEVEESGNPDEPTSNASEP